MQPASATPRYRHALPQLEDALFLTDGGLETTLIFHDGHDLSHFAAYDLLMRDGGEEALRRYFEPYVHIALEHGVGIVLETPTWRANPDWAALLGHSGEELEALNRRAVELLLELRDGFETDSTPIVVDRRVDPGPDDPKVEMRVIEGEVQPEAVTVPPEAPADADEQE